MQALNGPFLRFPQGKVDSTNAAKASVAASSFRRPMTCTPIGPPRSPRNPGTLTHGAPSNVQLRLKAGSPVELRPSGASSGALGVSNASVPSNQASNAVLADSAFLHAATYASLGTSAALSKNSRNIGVNSSR